MALSRVSSPRPSMCVCVWSIRLHRGQDTDEPAVKAIRVGVPLGVAAAGERRRLWTRAKIT